MSDLPEFSVVASSKLWVSTDDGLASFDGQKWQLYDADVRTNWLVKTSDGRLWTVNRDLGGIASFDGQKWNLEFNVEDSLLSKMTVMTQTVLATSTGEILLGTDEGLFQYDPVLNSITDLKLGKVNVELIYETTERSLWVATDKGLFKLADGNWQKSIVGQSINYIQQTNWANFGLAPPMGFTSSRTVNG